MLTKIMVLPERSLQNGTKAKSRRSGVKGATPGSKLYQEKGCIACHSIDGSPRVGPTFKGLLGKTETVVMKRERSKLSVVDEAYIRNYISTPQCGCQSRVIRPSCLRYK